jgi:hypothetical protein
MKSCVYILILSLVTFIFPLCAASKLGNKVSENQKLYGKELVTKQFSEDKKDFSGKKTYDFPMHGWQLEVIYRDGESYSEVVRPKGNKIKKPMIAEKEANVIADVLYPRKERGPYRKQVKNANFLSHFFDQGVVSYEMQLDIRRKTHICVIGIRTILYSNGDTFKKIMINAYY